MPPGTSYVPPDVPARASRWNKLKYGGPRIPAHLKDVKAI